MNESNKKIIALLASIVIIVMIYYGSFLPLRKSQIFISTMRYLGEAKTLDELKTRVSVPLDYPSPYGQEELVRQVASLVTNIVSQSNTTPPVIDDLISYLNKYYSPIIENGRGMSFNQNLYVLGSLNEVAFIRTNKVEYLMAAEKYFTRSYELGPKRPQALFGLFDVYRAKGDVAKVTEISNQILNQWPGEERTRQAVKDFLDRISAAQKK